MSFGFQPKRADEAELDVTSFMNLMVVLVPVLLIMLNFAQVSVIDIQLPELTGGSAQSEEEQSQLVVNIDTDGHRVYYPENVLIQAIPQRERSAEERDLDPEGPSVVHDFRQLSRVLREVKKQLGEHNAITLLSAPTTDYQTLVSTMDAARSYETVVAASVVEIELFPRISLGEIK
jgi:biopolymer transport protein ExbD